MRSILVAIAGLLAARSSIAGKCENPQAEKPAAALPALLRQHVSGNPPCLDTPQFAFTPDSVEQPPDKGSFINGQWPDKLVVASPTPGVAIVAMDLWGVVECTRPENLSEDAMGDPVACPRKPLVHDGTEYLIHHKKLRMTGVFEKRASGWQPLVWHYSFGVAEKDQVAATKQGTRLDPIAPAGGGEAVTLFSSTIGNAKAFVATIADRKDVVLYGSAPKERFVGGAAVKKTLAKWNLALKLQGGVRGGVTTNKQVAWVAANVEASVRGRSLPYRVLAIYQQLGGAWKLVQVHFSFISSEPVHYF